jgi:hypothetical protein
MSENFVDVRLNGSNLTLRIPQTFMTDWNENTCYDGKDLYIKRGISKKTRRRIDFVNIMLKKECDKMWGEYEIDTSTTTMKLDRI